MATEEATPAAVKSSPAESWSTEGYTKAAQDFVQGALQRTGTLYASTKEAVVKRSGSIYTGAKEGISEGLKRSGTVYQSAQEGVSHGLKRSGTVVGGATEGIVRRVSVLNQPAREGEPSVLQRTGTFIQQTGHGVIQRTGSWFEGASNYAYSFYDPNAPMRVSIREIAGIELPRVHHSLCVIDGRAYIFGGEVAPGKLADNAMHVVILPSAGLPEADYKSIAPRPSTAGGQVPEPRKGHSAVVVGSAILIFGGELAPKAKEESGRVWVFDTFSSKWTHLDPAPDAPYPQPRSQHTAAASEEPTPRQQATEYKSTTAEEQPANGDGTSDLHGTLFIHGGIALTPSDADGKEPASPDSLNDIWAFSLSTRTWLTLPPPPSPTRTSRLALHDSTLYRVNGADAATAEWSIDALPVGALLRRAISPTAAAAQPSLLAEWASTPLGRSAAGTAAAADMAVATAVAGLSGRRYLLVASAGGNLLALDVSPQGEGLLRAAGAEAPHEVEPEAQVVRRVVRVIPRWVDAFGEELPPPQAEALQRRFIVGQGFAGAQGSQVEEAQLVAWGGNQGAAVFGRGWLVAMEL